MKKVILSLVAVTFLMAPLMAEETKPVAAATPAVTTPAAPTKTEKPMKKSMKKGKHAEKKESTMK